MRSSLNFALAALVVALVGAVAFVAGARVGASENALLQSSVNGALLVGELKALRAGRVDSVIYGKELELDSQVLNFSKFQASGYAWLFWPESPQYEHERYLRSIATYRKEFPPVLPTSQATGSDEVAKEMRENNARVAITTKWIVETYGK